MRVFLALTATSRWYTTTLHLFFTHVCTTFVIKIIAKTPYWCLHDVASYMNRKFVWVYKRKSLKLVKINVLR